MRWERKGNIKTFDISFFIVTFVFLKQYWNNSSIRKCNLLQKYCQRILLKNKVHEINFACIKQWTGHQKEPGKIFLLSPSCFLHLAKDIIKMKYQIFQLTENIIVIKITYISTYNNKKLVIPSFQSNWDEYIFIEQYNKKTQETIKIECVKIARK